MAVTNYLDLPSLERWLLEWRDALLSEAGMRVWGVVGWWLGVSDKRYESWWWIGWDKPGSTCKRGVYVCGVVEGWLCVYLRVNVSEMCLLLSGRWCSARWAMLLLSRHRCCC